MGATQGQQKRRGGPGASRASCRLDAGIACRNTEEVSDEVVSRLPFRGLRQLNHPSIARIYDAGQTGDGQRYFTMELIDGEPLTEYCEGEDLSLRERLELFLLICRAVHYAHQRGVIHRDLKPRNILVDPAGVPHVLDFGLARFIDPAMDVTHSLFGGPGLMGTLAYMSPEHAAPNTAGIDIRSDVYSLGVILYEMLTGRCPYVSTGHVAEVLRSIAEAYQTMRWHARGKASVVAHTLACSVRFMCFLQTAFPR